MKRTTIPQKTRLLVHQKYDGKCAYCGQELAYKDMQIDHLVPICRTYYDEEIYIGEKCINNFDNLMPSCSMCNRYKSCFDIENLRKGLITLHKRVESNWHFRMGVKYGIIPSNEIIPFDGKFHFEKQ